MAIEASKRILINNLSSEKKSELIGESIRELQAVLKN